MPPTENVGGTDTPKIVTPRDEEPVEPAAITEAPSWTQSYSVTSQPGSPRISPKADMEELEFETHPTEPLQRPPSGAPVIELADVPETVVTPAVGEDGVTEPGPEEEPKSAWTQSYSVTSQPGSPRVSPKETPEEVPEVEEIKPSWTQSYSVTSQPGSPRVLSKENLEELAPEPITVADQPTSIVAPPVEEPASARAEAETETVERPKSPWISSYSVTTLEGQTEQAEDAEPGSEVVPVPETSASETPEPKPEADAPALDIPPSDAKEAKPEQAKSPWTPSYSVTTLPGSAPVEPELEPMAELSTGVETQAPVPVKASDTVDSHPKENGTTSDVFEVHEVVSQLTIHEEPQVDAHVSERNHEQLDLVRFHCSF